MRPVEASIEVPQPRQEVYDFLDVLGNHELFTDHMMRNWRLEGPERGVGAKAKVDAVLGGRTDPLEIEVIEARPPERSVERNVGAGGKRVATGTYLLAELPDGGTRVTFRYSWEKAPASEKLAAPLVRRVMVKAIGEALDRLAGQLGAPDR